MTAVSTRLERPRRVLVDHQGSGEGDRGGDGDRDERYGNRAHEKRHHAEMVGRRGPGLVGDEPESALSGCVVSVVAEEDHDGNQQPKDERAAACQHAVEDPVGPGGLDEQVDRDIVVTGWIRHLHVWRQCGHRTLRRASRRPIAPVSRSAIPDAATHASSGGGPVFARAAEAPEADVERLTAGTAPDAADGVAAATVVLVVPEFSLELVPAAVVVGVVPELELIRNGAENTLGAVKSF